MSDYTESANKWITCQFCYGQDGEHKPGCVMGRNIPVPDETLDRSKPELRSSKTSLTDKLESLIDDNELGLVERGVMQEAVREIERLKDAYLENIELRDTVERLRAEPTWEKELGQARRIIQRAVSWIEIRNISADSAKAKAIIQEMRVFLSGRIADEKESVHGADHSNSHGVEVAMQGRDRAPATGASSGVSVREHAHPTALHGESVENTTAPPALETSEEQEPCVSHLAMREYEKALQSIAASKCCGSCQEAALVAQRALNGEASL